MRYVLRFAPLLLIPFLAFGVWRAEAGTAVNAGELTADTTWTLAGSPYTVAGELIVPPGMTLTVEPGVEARFSPGAVLTVNGRLLANGTAAQKILFTGTNATKGSWQGINVKGDAEYPSEGSRISHATVEYGGGGEANVYVAYGKVSLSYVVLRRSLNDGFRADTGGGGSVIEASQIVENDEMAVRNDDGDAGLMASNNWWGATTGPTFESCNTGGTGGRIGGLGKVEFRPFLRSETSDPGDESPGDARILEMTPRRWYVPPDGVSRAYLDVELRDGNGQPLPGRTIDVTTTLGEVVDGGITDVQGRTLAFLYGDAAGTATLKARLNSDDGCEVAESSPTTVTFKSSDAASAYNATEAESPYMDDDIEADPMPIVRGRATTLRAKLTNPNDYAITVDATFAVAQLGIGLTFGPIGQVTKNVEPGETATFEVQWTPNASGDQCIDFIFSARPVGAARGAQEIGGNKRSNKSVNEGDTLDLIKKAAAKAAKTTGTNLRNAAHGKKMKTSSPSLPGPKLGSIKDIIDFNRDNGNEIHKALEGNDPDPCLASVSCNNRFPDRARAAAERRAQTFLLDGSDYTKYAVLRTFSYTKLQAGDEGLSAARVAAYNDLTDAWLDATAKLDAALVSKRRYSSATDDGDLSWAAQQSAALDYYLGLAGPALVKVADKTDALLAVEQSEGIADETVTAAEIQAFQARLQSSGWNASEQAAARLIGLSQDEIDYLLQDALSTDATAAAGSLRAREQAASAALRAFGQALTRTPTPLARRASTATNIAKVNQSTFSFVLRNPGSSAATIDLKTRRIGMPSDWMVALSPARPTLAAGASTTVNVTVTPGRAVTQGTDARVAIEGYSGTTLLDGVVLQVPVPAAATFSAQSPYRVFIPLGSRNAAPSGDRRRG